MTSTKEQRREAVLVLLALGFVFSIVLWIGVFQSFSKAERDLIAMVQRMEELNLKADKVLSGLESRLKDLERATGLDKLGQDD